MLTIFTFIFVIVQIAYGVEDFKIFFIPPLFFASFLASKIFKKYSDYVDGLINVLVMFLVTEVYKQKAYKYMDDIINFFIGQGDKLILYCISQYFLLRFQELIQTYPLTNIPLFLQKKHKIIQFAIILFVVYRGNNFLINLLSLAASYAIVYQYLQNSHDSTWIALTFSFLVVIQNYASSLFKRKTYLHKSYFKEIFQLDFPMNIFLTKYDKVTCRLILQDCNKQAFKRFRIDQEDQEGFSEFLKRIKVQQRRKSRSYLDNMNTAPEKEANLKEYLVSKYIKLNEELIQQRKRNQCWNNLCFKNKQSKQNTLHDFLHESNGKDRIDDQASLQKSVFNNENLFGYYYKKRDDSTYSKSFKIQMQLIDFYKEPSIAIFFEDETVQNDLVDVKLKKKKQKQLVISALNQIDKSIFPQYFKVQIICNYLIQEENNDYSLKLSIGLINQILLLNQLNTQQIIKQVREKVSSLVVLFREYSEDILIKQTKQMSIILLNQTFNLFDYIYLKERKKLMQKQQQLQNPADEQSIFKEQQQNKYSLILNLTEFPLKSLLKELYLVNPYLDIAFQDFGEDSKSEIHDYQLCAKDPGIQDFMIYNDYKRILQQNIQLTIKQFKETLYTGLEFSFKYGCSEVNDNELDHHIDPFFQTLPNQSINQELDLCLNKNFSDKRLKEIELYVIKTIVKEIGPNSLTVDKANNTVFFKIFNDIKVLQYEDEAKNTKNSMHNLNNMRKEKLGSLTNRPSQKSLAQMSAHNSSFCKTEVRNNQEYPQNSSPAIRTINNNQQVGQSPKQSFKIDLKDHFMSKARRSTYSRTLPPSNFISNNGESLLQSNHYIIDQKQNNITNTEVTLLSTQQINEKNGLIKEPEKAFVKTLLSPFVISSNFFTTKIDEISPNNTFDEGSDLPENKMSKYLPTIQN